MVGISGLGLLGVQGKRLRGFLWTRGGVATSQVKLLRMVHTAPFGNTQGARRNSAWEFRKEVRARAMDLGILDYQAQNLNGEVNEMISGRYTHWRPRLPGQGKDEEERRCWGEGGFLQEEIHSPDYRRAVAKGLSNREVPGLF